MNTTSINSLEEPLISINDKEKDPSAQVHLDLRRTLSRKCSTRDVKIEVRRKAQRFVIIVILLLTCYAIVLLIKGIDSSDDENKEDDAVYLSAGIVTILVTLLSARDISLHLRHWNIPEIQIKYAIMLSFPPVVSIITWLTLIVDGGVEYFDSILFVLKAYYALTFVRLSILLLGGRDSAVALLSQKDESFGVPKRCWIICFTKLEMGEHFLSAIEFGVEQFVGVQTFCAALVLIFKPFDMYGDGEYDFENVFVFGIIIRSMSLVWGMQSLTRFYHAAAEDLTSPVNFHPKRKFRSFLATMLITMLQTMVISLINECGGIPEIKDWDSSETAHRLNNYLICIEMVFVAVVNSFTYSYIEVEDFEFDTFDSASGIAEIQVKDEDINMNLL